MIRLYDYLDSGNGYKVRLILRLTHTPYELVQLDIFRGQTRTPEFLDKNPNGRIPLLEYPDGRRLAESNAILCYLAEGTPYLPSDAWQRALASKWLFFEQYSHEPNIATVRGWLRHGELTPDKLAQLETKRALGYAALGVLERELLASSYLVGERFTVADIALYAYTHVAHEGGFELTPFPAVRAWLERCHALVGRWPITLG
jgi:glutathione S-transferase